MGKIVDHQGQQYTTATEDLRLAELKRQFLQTLHKELLDALRTAQGGKLNMNMEPINAFLEQAYFLGREDQG